MELIKSFQIDHTDLKPGIYVSRVDNIGDEIITTYDIRMIHVNHEPAISPQGMHTIEHIVATYLRNNKEWKDKIIYWGPMGCCTGFYFIVKNIYNIYDIRSLILSAICYVCDFDGEIPGNSPKECGNYLFHNINDAKFAALKYRKCLIEDFRYEYNGKF